MRACSGSHSWRSWWRGPRSRWPAYRRSTTRPPAESASGPLVALAVVGLALYAYAAVRYLRLALERPSPLTIGVLTAFALLAEAMIAVAFARNWHASWWEWHLLMLAAFALVAYGAQRAGHGERFSALYLEDHRRREA